MFGLGAAGAAMGQVGVSLKAGLPGIGGDVTVGLSETLNLRGGVNWLSLTFESDDEEDGDEMSADLDLLSFPILLDWHPAGNNFRISAGAFVNDNGATGYAKPGDTIDFNDVEYTVTRADAEVSFESFCPYLGIGYGNAVGRDGNWHFAFDFGVFYHGTPQVDLTATASDPRLQPLLDADVEAERQDVEDDLEPFVVYPVISFGVSYKF
jgi:signal peptidase I